MPMVLAPGKEPLHGRRYNEGLEASEIWPRSCHNVLDSLPALACDFFSWKIYNNLLKSMASLECLRKSQCIIKPGSSKRKHIQLLQPAAALVRKSLGCC